MGSTLRLAEQASHGFGSLQELIYGEKAIGELGIFKGNGTEHVHDEWELCHVLSGSGDIFMVDDTGNPWPHPVKEGDFLAIPPDMGHWMEPSKDDDRDFTIFITYSPSFSQS